MSVTTKIKLRIYAGNLHYRYELWIQETNKLWHVIASLGPTQSGTVISLKAGSITPDSMTCPKADDYMQFKL